MSMPRCLALLVSTSLLVVAQARAQCLEWRSGFGSAGGGTNGLVSAQVVFDDGSGPALYIGGNFTIVANANCRNFARWDGTSWTGLASVGDGAISALAVYDDGSGPALYVAGTFTSIGGVSANRIAKWTGSGFAPLGTGLNNEVVEMLAFDDGSGSKLYAAGTFTTADGASSIGLARWDGISWLPMSLGTGGQGHALGVYDDGSGPKLFVGGNFSIPLTGGAAICIARWDGTGWSRLAGGGANFTVYKLDVFAGTSGPELYVAGAFTGVGNIAASRIARWNGTTWSALPGTFEDAIYTMKVYDDGSGPALYVGGPFDSITGIVSPKLARWNGTAWSSVGGGADDTVWSLGTFDEGAGARLFATGSFARCGGALAASVARWDGLAGSSVGPGNGASATVYGFAAHDDGGGPALYACGDFSVIGGVATESVARWTGSGWASVGTPLTGYVRLLESYDDGTGAQLYAIGGIQNLPTSVAHWNGSSWIPAGTGPFGMVYASAVFDDGNGPDLYCGGEFNFVNGVGMNRLARWNGSAWSSPSGPIFPDGIVYALAVYDDGSGPALYIGGTFTNVSSFGPANHIVKFDGTSWSTLGSGVDGTVIALQAFDDGSGSKLYVSGGFATAGGIAAPRMARWDGTTWSAFGGTVNNSATKFVVHDDGSGPALYAGGYFTSVGGVPARHIARWNGSAWSSLGSGLNETGAPGSGLLNGLASFDDGTGHGADLWVGGVFDSVGTVPSKNVAVWEGCIGTFGTFCHGDGSATPCPCANASAAGASVGCLNSLGNGGRLRGSGVTSLAADTLVLEGSAMPDSFALYYQGTAESNGGLGTAFGDGLRCAGGSVVRLKTVANSGGASQFPGGGDPSVSVRGGVSSPGSRTYQVWYRNAASFCTSATFNLTNGLKCVWAP